MKTKQQQKPPKWFKGELYLEGAEVTNPFSGECYTLSAEELSMYDFIIGCNYLMSKGSGLLPKGTITNFQRGLNWFRKNNPTAYMVLLD